jgi:hypothetical protein
VNQERYSFLVTAVIASAVISTLIVGITFLHKHLLPQADTRPARPAMICMPETQNDGLAGE